MGGKDQRSEFGVRVSVAFCHPHLETEQRGVPAHLLLCRDDLGARIHDSANDTLRTDRVRLGPYCQSTQAVSVARMEGWDPSKLPSTPGSRVDAATSIDTTTPASVTDDVASRPRPASISHTSVLSPDSTGNSSAASGRSQSVEDTLAVAAANALKRLEARRKAQGDTTTVTAAPSIGAPIEAPEVEARKSSPFGDLFSPPSNSSTAADSTPDQANPGSC